MPKKPNQWQHKRSTALIKREKDIAQVAELHLEGLTFREIGLRLGMAVAVAHARYRDAIERYKERAAEAHDARAAAYRAKREFLYREAIAAWRRSQVEQERRRARKRQGPAKAGEGDEPNVVEWTEEEIEVKKLLGDPRFLAEADKQLNALARLDALDAPQKHEITGKDGQPVNLFQLLLQAPRGPAVEIGEDGEEHVIEASSTPLLPGPDGGDGNGEGFEDL